MFKVLIMIMLMLQFGACGGTGTDSASEEFQSEVATGQVVIVEDERGTLVINIGGDTSVYEKGILRKVGYSINDVTLLEVTTDSGDPSLPLITTQCVDPFPFVCTLVDLPFLTPISLQLSGYSTSGILLFEGSSTIELTSSKTQITLGMTPVIVDPATITGRIDYINQSIPVVTMVQFQGTPIMGQPIVVEVYIKDADPSIATDSVSVAMNSSRGMFAAPTQKAVTGSTPIVEGMVTFTYTPEPYLDPQNTTAELTYTSEIRILLDDTKGLVSETVFNFFVIPSTQNLQLKTMFPPNITKIYVKQGYHLDPDTLSYEMTADTLIHSLLYSISNVEWFIQGNRLVGNPVYYSGTIVIGDLIKVIVTDTAGVSSTYTTIYGY